jgi:hypothetical protein
MMMREIREGDDVFADEPVETTCPASKRRHPAPSHDVRSSTSQREHDDGLET